MKKLHLFILIACVNPLFVKAQTADIETDRPSQSSSPKIVLAKHLQLELGLRKEFDKSNGQKQELYLYPTALLKYGLAKKFELRLLIENEGDYEFIPSKHKSAGGLKPVEVGFKYNLVEEKGCIPTTSLIASASMPKFASHDFQTDFVAPGFILAFENSLSEKVSLTYNAGIQWEADDVHAHYIYTLCPQFEITNHLKAFAEVYGFLSNNATADHRVDAGFSYLIKPGVQVDLSGGLGISQHSPDSFIEAGLSFRLPH